jgi:hypothetical protein
MNAQYIKIGENFYNYKKVNASITNNYINLAQFDKHGNIEEEITINTKDFEKFLQIYTKIKKNK